MGGEDAGSRCTRAFAEADREEEVGERERVAARVSVPVRIQESAASPRRELSKETAQVAPWHLVTLLRSSAV